MITRYMRDVERRAAYEAAQAEEPTMTDFELHDHGSIIILVPLTPDAHDWVEENLPEDVTWYGRGIAIEPRYVAAILEGIYDGGLTIDGDLP